MTTFDNREKGFEGKFFYDEEIKFKAVSRRRKLLGLWAAEKMHLDEDSAVEYANEIVKFGVEDNSDGAVVNKILEDLVKMGLDISEEDIRESLMKCHEIAGRQVMEKIKHA